MAISMQKRGGIVFDLLQNGDVSNEALYTNLDVAAQNVIIKYTTGVWNKHGPGKDQQGNIIQNPTPAQLIGFTFQQFRIMCAEAVGEKRVADAGRAAQDAERAAVKSEAENELGTQ